MTELKKGFIIAVVSIAFACVLLGLSVLAVCKISVLADEVSRLNNKLASIDNNIDNSEYNIINSIRNEIQRQLTEESLNNFDISYGIVELNTAKNTAVIEVFFSLKESPLSGNVSVSYGKNNLFSEIEATKLANGKYKAAIELQMDKDYEVNYSVTLSSVKTEKLLDINVLNTLKKRFSLGTGFRSEDGRSWILEFDLSNHIKNDSHLKIATATLEILKSNAIIKTINLLNYSVAAGEGYEQFGSKNISLSGLPAFDETRVTIVDNYGIKYIFEKL